MQFSVASAFFVGLICFLTFLGKGNGLNCYSCYPCTGNDPGTSGTCDKTPYSNLPGKGQMACSYEYGAGGVLRRRCRFIRHDPDLDGVSEVTRCTKSPFDESKDDCLCFSDDCNKDKPVGNPDYPDLTGSAGDFKGARYAMQTFLIVSLPLILAKMLPMY